MPSSADREAKKRSLQVDGSAGMQQDRVEKPEHVDERLPTWHARPLRKLFSIRERIPNQVCFPILHALTSVTAMHLLVR